MTAAAAAAWVTETRPINRNGTVAATGAQTIQRESDVNVAVDVRRRRKAAKRSNGEEIG